jgi:hypothetical protein
VSCCLVSCGSGPRKCLRSAQITPPQTARYGGCQSKRNEPKTDRSAKASVHVHVVARVARAQEREREKAWLGLGGGAVYELLVGLREEDKAKS